MTNPSSRSPLLRVPTRRYNDRRFAPRLQTFLRADYTLYHRTPEGLSATGLRRGIAADVSSTGLFLTDTSYLPLGGLVHVYLRVPDVPARPVVGHARVVRVDTDERSGYGLRFVRLRFADVRRLSFYVRVQLARADAYQAG